jgi:small subunit ribosomal protein S16
MLTIRMQRTGRKGHAMFRMVVQDSRQAPTSGKVVALLGSYDPHAKSLTINKEKAAFYLEHGAQPSDRAARLLKNDGIKLPDWVKLSADRERTIRNPEKRRSTAPEQPAEEEAAPAPEEASAEEAPAEAASPETEPAEEQEPEKEASEEQ